MALTRHTTPAQAKAPFVPESVLKKRKRQEKWAEESKAAAAAAQTKGA